MPKKLRYPVIVKPLAVDTRIICADLKLDSVISGHPPIKALQASCAAQIKQKILVCNREKQKVPLPGNIADAEAKLPANSSDFVIQIECDDVHQHGICEKLARYSAYPLQIIDSCFDAFASFLALAIPSKGHGEALPILGILFLFIMDIIVFVGVDAPSKFQNIGKYLDDLCRNEVSTEEQAPRRNCKTYSLNLFPYIMLHFSASVASAIYALTTYHTLIALAHRGNSEEALPAWLSGQVLYILADIAAVFSLISNMINSHSVAHEVARKYSIPFQLLPKRRNSMATNDYQAIGSPSPQ